MYYFVDESGNTGLHLFDAAQPLLYYGVLGARANLDVIAFWQCPSGWCKRPRAEPPA